MRKNILLATLLTVSLALPFKFANAAFSNPDPATFQDDSGSELFSPTSGNQFFTLELADLGSSVTDTIFGFYVKGTDPTDPSNRIELFGPGNHNTAQAFLVDLTAGIVFDLNTASVAGSFAAAGSVIGFYYELPLLGDMVLYSQSSLNSGGLDAFGFFPLIADPTVWLVEVAVPDGNGGSFPLAFELAANLNAIPEPGVLALIGLAGLLFNVSRSKAGVKS
ncbi:MULTISPECIES: PEP-CTERM sorting domain-containing protein [Methylomonas]|uniref:PEP-CTERM sorting domain-containing protein n=1 Tax=Methylomonas TaxID=416 RepID=UPI00168043DD|nr:PEP-CTERM sorting domain-containing protein [Methylomonas rhizoryzae]